MSARVRANVCYRIGGEEFAVVLASTDRAGGRPITVSVGTASMDVLPHLDTEELYRRADFALFEAKHRGRSWVVAYEKND